MAGFHLAQLNIALPREPLDAPLLADFVAALAPVNDQADRSPGFVWRLQTEEGDATGIRAFGDDRLVVNMSTWESLDALRAFAYENRAHLAVLRRRREWFDRMDVSQCLWWVAAGHAPGVAEAEERLTLLRALGPTPDAFTFQRHFPTPAASSADAVDDARDLCPA